MNKLLKLFAFAGACVMSGLASANANFDWTGSGGVVTVPSGVTAEVLDEDIAAVQALTSILLTDYSSCIYFRNTQEFAMGATIGPAAGFVYKGNADSYSHPVLKMDAATGRVTFNGDVYFSDGVYMIVGNVLVNARFGSARTSNYGDLCVLTGCTAEFSGSSSWPRQYYQGIKGGGRIKMGGTFSTNQDNVGLRIYDGAEILCDAYEVFNRVKGDVYFANGGKLDMNGFDQTVFRVSGGSDAASGSPKIVEVTSEATAILTFDGTGHLATWHPARMVSSLQVSGRVVLVHCSTETNVIVNGISDTIGALSMQSGRLEFGGYAKWLGPEVQVSGGRLVASPLAGGTFGTNTAVYVSGDGVLEIPAGATVQMGSLEINGTAIDVSYPRSVQSIIDEYGVGANLTGGGEIAGPVTYYVDPDWGDDDNNGRTEGTAFKTFQGAFANYVPGTTTTIIALPGTYDAGTMPGEIDTKGAQDDFRLVIPQDITVRSRDGAETTIIDGGGTVRGVKLVGPTSRLQGFTITHCESTTDGAAVRGANNISAVTGYVLDSIISNNTANAAAGGAGFTAIRCKFIGNTAGYAAGVRSCKAYNCYFKGNSSHCADATHGGILENCTLNYGSSSALRNWNGGVIKNCVFVGTGDLHKISSGSYTASFENCVFQTMPTHDYVADSACRQATVSELALDANGVPTRDSVLVNAGDNAKYLAGFPEGEDASLDGRGGDRVCMGALDIGAFEYDPCEDMGEVLSDKGCVHVERAAANVAFGTRGVLIPAGDGVSLVFDPFPGAALTPYLFSVSVPEGGSFTYGTTVLGAGEHTVNYDYAYVWEFEATYEGEGAAEIYGFDNEPASATINATDHGVTVTGASIGVNYLSGGPITFTIERAYDSENLSTGFNSNGVFYAWEDYPNGFTYTVTDQDSSITIDIVYSTEPVTVWYVSPSGNDSAKGYHPGCPLHTIAAAMAKASSGHTVIAAPGTYDYEDGEDVDNATYGGSRVVVKGGVTLKSSGGRAVTTIVGRKATEILSGGGCGTDSLRCVRLEANAKLIGFALTGGYSRSTGAAVANGVNGGAVWAAANTAYIVDCEIRNCVSSNLGVCYKGSYIGCYIHDCDGVNTYGKGVRDGCVYNCYLEGLKNGFTSSIAAAPVNCTFKFVSGNAVLHNYSQNVYNCLFISGTVKPEAAVYNRCALSSELKDGSTSNDGTVASQTFTFDENRMPTSANLRDAGNNEYTNNIPEALRVYLDKDAMGNQRVYGGAIDIGAIEFIPPPASARINVPDHGVTITGAEPGFNEMADEPLTFTIRRAFDSTYLSTGFNSNGVFYAWEDYPNGFTYTVTDRDSSITIDIVYAAQGSREWYVNANTGSNDNKGIDSSVPFLTLAKAMEMASSGETVHAARGVYDQGAVWTDYGYSRVLVPAGVKLVADEGRDVTFIEGAKAEPAEARLQHEGCGTNSVRCVSLAADSELRGFTLRNGYARSFIKNAASDGDYGGGFRFNGLSSSGDARKPVVFDCLVTNCYAHGAAAGYCCTLDRCRIVGNRSYLGYRVAVTEARLFNCYFKSNTTPQTNQGHLTDCREVVNCTFAAGQPVIRANGYSTKCYNCVFLGVPISQDPGDTNRPEFHNCVSVTAPTIASEKYVWDSDCQVIPELALYGNLAPRQAAARNSATGYTYYTNRVTTVIGETEAALDLNGNPRCGDGVIDLGCAQFIPSTAGSVLIFQ